LRRESLQAALHTWSRQENWRHKKWTAWPHRRSIPESAIEVSNSSRMRFMVFRWILIWRKSNSGMWETGSKCFIWSMLFRTLMKRYPREKWDWPKRVMFIRGD